MQAMTTDDLRRKIKRRLADKNMTPAQLATAAAIPADTLDNWLGGGADIYFQELLQVLDQLGIELEASERR